MKKTSVFLCVLILIFAACDAGSSPSTPPGTADQGTLPVTDPASAAMIEVQLGAGYGIKGSWFELYFTDPTRALAGQETGGVDGPLVEAIDSARLSVDLAVYSLSLNSVRNALLRAQDRGIQVRVVMESDNLDRADPQLLVEAGISVLGDRREGLMHNKFVIIDASEVWLGSMNLTDSGAYRDDNVLIRIRSEQMAQNYTQEFEEMYLDDKFGPDIVAQTPLPRLILDGIPFDVYFSPDDQVQPGLVELVNNARESIYFMAYSFTADAIGEAVRARAQDGIIVSGVMDSDQIDSNIGTEYDTFKQAGLDVLRDGNEGQMHHKIMIIDESIVLVGSYNFTNSAETKNDENLIVIYDGGIAAEFMKEFARVYSMAQ